MFGQTPMMIIRSLCGDGRKRQDSISFAWSQTDLLQKKDRMNRESLSHPKYCRGLFPVSSQTWIVLGTFAATGPKHFRPQPTAFPRSSYFPERQLLDCRASRAIFMRCGSPPDPAWPWINQSRYVDINWDLRLVHYIALDIMQAQNWMVQLVLN